MSASSPGCSGSAESSSAGSTTPRISWALFNSLASLSSSGDSEIGSNHSRGGGMARRPNSSRVTVLEFTSSSALSASSWQVGFCHWPALFSSAASSQRSLTPSSGRSVGGNRVFQKRIEADFRNRSRSLTQRSTAAPPRCALAAFCDVIRLTICVEGLLNL